MSSISDADLGPTISYKFILHNKLFSDEWYIIGEQIAWSEKKEREILEEIYPRQLDKVFRFPFNVVYLIKSIECPWHNFYCILQERGYQPVKDILGCRLYNISKDSLIDIVKYTCRKSEKYEIIKDTLSNDYSKLKKEIGRLKYLIDSLKMDIQSEYHADYLFWDTFGGDPPFNEPNKKSKEYKEMEAIKDKLYQIRDYYKDSTKRTDSFMSLALMELWRAYLIRQCPED